MTFFASLEKGRSLNVIDAFTFLKNAPHLFH